jgi:NADH-quinone oxidoreductase subunit M
MAVIVVLGIYPKPLLDVINPAVHSSYTKVRSHDPNPSRPPQAGFVGNNQVNSTGGTP